jgi:hypothetical protein|tara:strand:+ start:1163 stop:1441 length:279 start_codon:yes stop_codon:yes gene_type:complete
MAEYKKEDKIILWLYPNDNKKTDKHPNMTGPGKIDKDVLKDLVEAYKNHGKDGALRLRAATWERQGKKGPYTFVAIEVERPKVEEPQDEIPF